MELATLLQCIGWYVGTALGNVCQLSKKIDNILPNVGKFVGNFFAGCMESAWKHHFCDLFLLRYVLGTVFLHRSWTGADMYYNYAAKV